MSSSDERTGSGRTTMVDGMTFEVLIDEAELASRIQEIGRQISKDYNGLKPAIVAVLKGSFVFLADLVRAIDIECTVDFLVVSSYGNDTKSSGVVQISSDLTTPVEGRHVILVEDIVDTGLTMSYLLKNLDSRSPASVKVCTLLEKPSRLQVEVPIHYKGFTIDDHFVVGYGLDYAQTMRNLPFIGYKVG